MLFFSLVFIIEIYIQINQIKMALEGRRKHNKAIAHYWIIKRNLGADVNIPVCISGLLEWERALGSGLS